MNFIDMRKYLETGFAAQHLPTGRVFVLVPSHDISASVLGGRADGFLPVAESYMECIKELLVPSCIPSAFMMDEFKAVPMMELFPRAWMETDSLHDIAVSENRIGIVKVSAALYGAFVKYLRYVAGASIVSEQYDNATDSTEILMMCPDFKPVKDGMATPRYTMVVTEDSNVVTWVLDKSFEL
jgi:hypothetical protein